MVHGDLMQLDRFPYEKIREEKLPTLSVNQKAHLHARKACLRKVLHLVKKGIALKLQVRARAEQQKRFQKGAMA